MIYIIICKIFISNFSFYLQIFIRLKLSYIGKSFKGSHFNVVQAFSTRSFKWVLVKPAFPSKYQKNKKNFVRYTCITRQELQFCSLQLNHFHNFSSMCWSGSSPQCKNPSLIHAQAMRSVVNFAATSPPSLITTTPPEP